MPLITMGGLYEVIIYSVCSRFRILLCLVFCLLYVLCISILCTCKWSVDPLCPVIFTTKLQYYYVQDISM